MLVLKILIFGDEVWLKLILDIVLIVLLNLVCNFIIYKVFNELIRVVV